MEAIIILSIGTALCLIASAITKSERSRNAYLVTAIIFLFLIGSHAEFNPEIEQYLINQTELNSHGKN